jgi:CheY-like chemotaxis protein
VLLVDDDEDIRDLLGDLMRRWGYHVRTAANGVEALREIARSRPRVALLDIGMPLMDGYSAAKRICEKWGTRRPRLVAMTGFGQPEDRQRAFDAGFERHLIKPVDSEELSRVLVELTAAGEA